MQLGEALWKRLEVWEPVCGKCSGEFIAWVNANAQKDASQMARRALLLLPRMSSDFARVIDAPTRLKWMIQQIKLARKVSERCQAKKT